MRVARCLARAPDQRFQFPYPQRLLLDQILLLRQQRVLLGVTQPETGKKRHAPGEPDRRSAATPRCHLVSSYL